MSDPSDLGGGLFVGSIESTLDLAHLHSLGVSHIVAVGKEFTEDTERFRSFQLHVVPIHDGPHELLKNYIPNALIFMEKALNRGGKVLIFSESGASRAVAFAAAALMYHQGLSLEASLAKIRSEHPLVASSFHFFSQLKELETSSSDFMKKSASGGKDDGAIGTDVGGGVGEPGGAVLFIVRCRKCRRELCTSDECVDHEKPEEDKAFQRRSKYGMHANKQCNSLFLEQQEWFGDISEPEGKILCPHCGARVGTWKWHGTQCSCSAWVAPAFQIHKGRVDVGKR